MIKFMNIMILVNKDFEYAGYRAGVEYQITAGKTPHLQMERKVGSIYGEDVPPCAYNVLDDSGNLKHQISEYCISYLFAEDENSSNSEIKFGKLIDFFDKVNKGGNAPDLIISVSTSESCPDVQGVKGNTSVNGSVFMGCKFFALDCQTLDDTDEPSQLPVNQNFMESSSKYTHILAAITANHRRIIDGMQSLPNYPAETLFCDANPNNISLGVINVTNYTCYSKADLETYSEYNKRINRLYKPVGLETTHAVVKMALEAHDKTKGIPVLFVSPVVDRYLKFDVDVDDKWGNQNRLGSYNAGVVVANMLELINNELSTENNKEEETK